MQNEWNNGMNQYPYNGGDDGSDKGRKQFVLGLTIGILVTVLAALLTVAVGATLIAVMMPLIGIMGSIG